MLKLSICLALASLAAFSNAQVFEKDVRIAYATFEFPNVDFVEKFGHPLTEIALDFRAELYELLTQGVNAAAEEDSIRSLRLGGSQSIEVTVGLDSVAMKERLLAATNSNDGLCLKFESMSFCTSGPFIDLNGKLPTTTVNTTAAPTTLFLAESSAEEDTFSRDEVALIAIAGTLTLIALIVIVVELRRRRNIKTQGEREARESYISFAHLVQAHNEKDKKNAGNFPSFNAHPPVANFSIDDQEEPTYSRANSSVGLLTGQKRVRDSSLASRVKSYALVEETSFASEEEMEERMRTYDQAVQDHSVVDIDDAPDLGSLSPQNSQQKRVVPPPQYGSVRSISICSSRHQTLGQNAMLPPNYAPPPAASVSSFDSGREMPAPPPRRSLRKPAAQKIESKESRGLAVETIEE